MSTYDTFHGKCPFCNANYAGQSKWFECELFTFEPGNAISDIADDMRLEMKDKCIGCNKYPVAVIKEGVFIGFEKDNPTDREGHFGQTLLSGQARKNQYWDSFGIAEPKE